MNLAQVHRQALCDAAVEVGADAATLCEGWAVRDLLAHLVVRDSRPDAGITMAIPLLAKHGRAVHARLAVSDFGALVDKVRSGPPRLSPIAISRIDAAVNTAEFVVHHADIVRAQPRQASATVLPAEAATAEAMWVLVRRAGRVLYRKAPVGVVAVASGHGRAALRRPRRGYGSVVLTGSPVELLLHAFGRVEHAAVTVSGEDADMSAFADTVLGA